jgi:glycosyltransferase involved in cell wall biosynthesis
VPSFSVVIACYQAADTIGEALESAFAQTVPPREVIVSDDGSTDDLDAALAPFRERIVLLRSDRNRGVGAAKNEAFRVAGGDFVVILDADDVFYRQRLEALGRLSATRPDLDVLTTNADLDVDGRVVGRYYPLVARFPVVEQRQGVLADDSAVFGAAAIRRTRLLDLGGFDPDLSHGADWECWMRLALDGSLFGLVNEPLYRYRMRPTSMTADRAQAWRTNLPVLEQTLRDPRATAEDRNTLRDAHAHYLRLALLTEAEQALRSRSRAARHRSWAVATGHGFGPPTRVKAVFAAVFPRTTARLLERRERRTGRSRLLRGLPEDD